MKKISEVFAQKVISYGVLDTRKYRYRAVECYGAPIMIDRIALDALGTTEALHIKSDYHPNGWETVYYAMAVR